MDSLIIDMAKELISAWRDGSKKIRGAILTAIVLVTLAILVVTIGKFFPGFLKQASEGIAGILGIIGGVISLSIFAFQKANEEEKRERHLEQVEKRVHDNPQETQAAWELARGKLESYLNRN